MKNVDCTKYINLLKKNKNIILHGAPGTGKTYLAKQIANEMGCSDENIGFVQFHPSYDYTDFVEGLRPTSKDDNGNILFERKNGVFKEFCNKAFFSKSVESNEIKLINDSPTIWKVSLEGTGDNETRRDCMENGWIRIGWSEYGDVEDFDDFEDFHQGGKYILRTFQHKMQIGDIVLSCYSASEIDAIGVVTGEYEYREEGKGYSRYRNVKWLVKGIRENIVELNHGTKFTLSTVYKLQIPIESVLEIVKKYSDSKQNVAPNQPFVFVIDEINRGELSKIFGELFFSIDPGYRGKKGKVKTQYQNLIEPSDTFASGFYIPENVYIIGTMNDIDRSVESMDFAMRRRFAFIEVTAEESADNMGLSEKSRNKMNAINQEIDKIDGLNKSYNIGGAYFIDVDNVAEKERRSAYDDLWEYKLEGLIREYLRGIMAPDEQDETLNNIKSAYDNAE